MRKKLTTALNKESAIAFINGKVMLKENLKEIAPEVFTSIREFLKGRQSSESTEFFVENFAKVARPSPDFAATCFALNFIMTTQYKIDLQQTSGAGWGKWHLISALYHIRRTPWSAKPILSWPRPAYGDRKNLLQKRKKFEEQIFTEGETRYFLTQREIASGAVRLKPGLYHFGDAIEIRGRRHRHAQEAHPVLLSRTRTCCWASTRSLKAARPCRERPWSSSRRPAANSSSRSRPPRRAPSPTRSSMIPRSKIFVANGEKMASTVAPNKSIFLETEVFQTLAERLEEFRKAESYNKLFHKVFLEFGSREKNYEIHILRLYHILDLIAPVDLRAVEEIILSNPEFIPSEKLAGVFYLDSDAVVEIEEEEKLRRQGLIEDQKRKREESRKLQHDEELKAQEEIRLLREERRKKREEEMWQKEKLQEEKEAQRRAEAAFAAQESAAAAARPARKPYGKDELPSPPPRSPSLRSSPRR